MASEKIKMGAYDGLHGIFHHLDTLQKWKAGYEFPPLYVEVSPSDQCNQRCFYCYADHLGYSNTYMPEDMIINLFRDMGQMGVKCCEIQGTGEPLLNNALPKAIIEGKKNGTDIVLVTNGTLLSDIIISQILPSLSFLRVSSLAHNAETYARLHGCSANQFYQVLHAIKECVRLKEMQKLDVVIVVTFLLFDFNMLHMFDTAKMSKELGVNIFKLWPTIDQGRNASHDWKRDRFHEIFAAEIQKTKELNDSNFQVYLNSENLSFFMNPIPQKKPYPLCYGVEFETHIDSDGKIYPCQFCWKDKRYCLGDLNKDSFSKIWFGDDRKKKTELFLHEVDTTRCEVFCCKQHSINHILYQIANPPRHVNII